MPVRIFVADDHDIVREGIKSILRSRPDWLICGEASDGKSALEGIRRTSPDVVVLDVSMPVMTGLDVAKAVSPSLSGVKLLFFTMHDSRSLIESAKHAGAHGLVSKTFASRDLVKAMDALLSGGTFFGPQGGEKPKTRDSFGNFMLLFQVQGLSPA